MKKFLICCLVLLTLGITACSSKLTTYKQIKYVDYLQKLNNGDTFPLVIGSKTCSACAVFKGTMETFIEKYQAEVFFIDVSDLSEEEYNMLKSDINFDGTPTTIFIKDGKITSYYNRLDGAVNLSKVVDYYKANNYID